MGHELTIPTDEGFFERFCAAARRVRTGLCNARAKGKRLGRPRVSVSAAKIQELRAEGLTLRDIATRCRVSKTTVIRALK
jgi:DNA invertase Pin-like site-specific DNA recombinase